MAELQITLGIGLGNSFVEAVAAAKHFGNALTQLGETMKGYKYILKGKEVVKCYDVIEWANWIDKKENLRVNMTVITDKIQVSTVFTTIDPKFSIGCHKPKLFETAVLGGRLDGKTETYSTWGEAEKGHDRMVERVRNNEKGRRIIVRDNNSINEGN